MSILKAVIQLLNSILNYSSLSLVKAVQRNLFLAEEINPENLPKSADANAKKSTDTRIERDITSATPSTTQSSPEKYQPPMSIRKVCQEKIFEI